MNTRRNIFCFACIALVALCVVACTDQKQFPSFPEYDNAILPPDKADTIGMNIPEEAITVAEARAIGKELGNGGTSSEKYYIKGFIKGFGTKHEDGMKNFGNAVFYMVDRKGATTDFEAYQVYGIGGNKFTDMDQLQVGDYVVVYSQITNYNGTIETVGKGAAYVYASNNLNAYPEKEYAYLNEDFAQGQGNWTIHAINDPGINVWSPQSAGGKTCMQAFASVDDYKYAGEVWMVSETINLKAMGAVAPKLSFNHYHQLCVGNPEDQLLLKITTDGANWADIAIPVFSAGTLPRYANSGEIDITDYIGETVQIAFVYISSAESAPRWSVTDVRISEMRHIR